jgi:hypothetical protein
MAKKRIPESKIVPTTNQKKVAKMIVEQSASGKKISGKQILAKAGYGKGMAKHAGQVINSRGVKKQLKLLGFDVTSARKVGAAILNHGEEQNKVAVMREIFKIYGSYAPEKQQITGTVKTVRVLSYATKK